MLVGKRKIAAIAFFAILWIVNYRFAPELTRHGSRLFLLSLALLSVSSYVLGILVSPYIKWNLTSKALKGLVILYLIGIGMIIAIFLFRWFIPALPRINLSLSGISFLCFGHGLLLRAIKN